MSMEQLQARIKQLEEELKEEKSKNAQLPSRQKIEHMSPEVVDSNPYR